jgi:hypothetical protein
VHDDVHVPAEQAATITFVAAHERRHAPQCWGSARVSTSQSVMNAESQSAKPGSQKSIEHVPDAHLPWPPAIAHELPQNPQFAGDVLTSVSHVPFASQSLNPDGQFETLQRPASQVHSPPAAVQSFVHDPHAVGSALMLRSHPVSVIPSQSWKPKSQEPSVHLPLAQLTIAFGRSHFLPQLPQ